MPATIDTTTIDAPDRAAAVIDHSESLANKAMQTIHPNTRRSLWKISDDMNALHDLIEEVEDETLDQCGEVLAKWFEDNSQAMVTKLDNYAAFIGELEARAEDREAEAKRLLRRAQIDSKAASWLKKNALEFMQRHGHKKIETPRYKLSVCGAGGKAPLVLDPSVRDHAEQLPEQFRKVSYAPNTDAIRAAIEAGEKLDFAMIGERGHYLRIS